MGRRCDLANPRGIVFFRRVAAMAAIGSGLLAVLMMIAPQAGAHAVVVSSDPADGGRIAKAPSAVTVRFDEPVGLELGYLRVVDMTGQRVDTGSAGHPAGDGTSIRVGLRGGLGDGSYLVNFRVLSADSHPVAGAIRFVVGNGPLGASGGPSGTSSVNPGVAVALATSDWLGFAGIALIGGSWLTFSIWPAGQQRRTIRHAIWAGWGLAVAGAVGEYLAQGPFSAGSSLAAAIRPSLLDGTLHEHAGQLLSLRLVLLGVQAAILTAVFDSDERRRPTWGPHAAGIVALGIVVTHVASGHAESNSPRWLAISVAGLHFTAMVVWLGGLAILVIAAFGRSTEAERADDAAQLAAGMAIFSRVAVASVAILAVTGTLLAMWDVGTVDAISTTWYGRLVLTKVGLLAGLVGLGYFARRTVLRGDWAITGGPLERMRRALAVEVMVGAVVLGVTGVLIAQPPGKVALTAERSKPRFSVVKLTPSTTARVTVNPGRQGSVQISVELNGSTTPLQVSATASMAAHELGPIPIRLQAAGPRSYTGDDVVLPAAGAWDITLTVRTSEFDSTTAIARLRLSR